MAITVGTDSYITVAEADTIMGNVLDNTLWVAAINDTKERALKMACRHMENLNYVGFKYDLEQKLQFPRIYQGVSLSVPDEIKIGQAYLANTMLQKGGKTAKTNIESESVDGIGSRKYGRALTDKDVYKDAYDVFGKWTQRAVDWV
jgi:hypothetical protein